MNQLLLLLLLFPLLQSLTLNLLQSSNTIAHHTDKYKGQDNTIYSNKYLITRRGQPFYFTANEKISTKSTLRLKSINPLTEGYESSFFPEVDIPFGGQGSKWNFERENFVFRVDIPIDAPIGMWKMQFLVEGVAVETGAVLIVLFNPFVKGDQVYMEKDLEEYVMEENGLIWNGNSVRNVMGWVYDQFSQDSLLVGLYLVGKMNKGDSSNVVDVARYLPLVVNANNGFGVLIGQWNEPYLGGVHPTEWQGSKYILQQFRKTVSPVKYAQCWVFAGVLTTLGRTLGIPSRTITNYQSAHEYRTAQGYVQIIDEFFDQEKRQFATGSIWNFHAWSEFWMKRNDLNNPFAGWQVVDATPQELSFDRYYRVGPAAVGSIRNKNTDEYFDNDFVLSEVDSLYRRWVSWDTGSEKHSNYNYWLYSETYNAVGTGLHTKMPGRNARKEVTSSYKTPRRSRTELKRQISDPSFNLNLVEIPDLAIGDDLTLELDAQCGNCETEARTMNIYITLTVATYTGHEMKEILRAIRPVLAIDNSVHHIHELIPPQSYAQILKEASCIKYSIYAEVYSGSNFTKESYSFIGDIPLNTEAPFIQVLAEAPDSFEQEIYISVNNPLERKLTNVRVQIDGVDIKEQIILEKDIPALSSAHYYQTIELYKPWKDITGLFVSIYSNELPPMRGILN